MKKILLHRIYKGPHYTIGHLYVNEQYLCDTIEDTDRGLHSGMSVEDILKKKIKAKTAIPSGVYKVTLNVVSPKFNRYSYYHRFCSGMLPRLINVKGFDGILIHCGKDENSSSGCIIVGYNTVKGRVTNSREAFEKLYRALQGDNDITITIT